MGKTWHSTEAVIRAGYGITCWGGWPGGAWCGRLYKTIEWGQQHALRYGHSLMPSVLSLEETDPRYVEAAAQIAEEAARDALARAWDEVEDAHADAPTLELPMEDLAALLDRLPPGRIRVD